MSRWLLDSTPLTPHGFCLLWEPWLIRSFMVGDAGTALAYFAIPVAFARFASRRADLAFKPVVWLFAAFILLCGVTHWLDILTIWVPAYQIQAILKVATAAVSIATAIAVWRLLPAALALPSPAQMRQSNESLLAREAQLRALNLSLEEQVIARTTELAANEAKLKDLLATLDLGTFVTRDLDGVTRFWSEGCTLTYGWNSAEAIGRNVHELLNTVFPVPLSEIEEALATQGIWTGEVRHRAKDGREVIVSARKVLRRDEAGHPVAVLDAFADVTATREAERERQKADALLRGIVASAPGLIFAKDREGRLLLGNAPVAAFLGKPWEELQGRTDLEVLDDKAQAEAVMANDRRVMDEGCTEELEELVGTEDGLPRVWLSTKTPLRGADGRIEGLVGVSVEITQRKRAEQRLRLMVHELNHRVKNTLATVQAVASQTLRRSDPAAVEALLSRLRALALAHDVLTQENWETAMLDDVVAAAMAPHGGLESRRFFVSGPRVRLLPREALSLAMAFHELTTNALKYGSLSPDAADGRVEVIWTNAGDRLHLVWRERGGPPVAYPLRRGFGTHLVERSLSQDLEGEVTLSFEPEGVTCIVDAALGAARLEQENALAFPEVGSI